MDKSHNEVTAAAHDDADASREGRPRVLPPVWLLIAFAAMWLLHRFVPLIDLGSPALRWIGGAFIVAGLAFITWCILLFRRADTSIVPFTQSETLITWGPYRVSRNPIYAGMLLILLGAADILGTLTPFLVIPAFVWLMRRRFIDREEVLLAARFGADYLAYKSRVRRWL
ncbi:MAG: methyltransferase family protein [Gemmatimonadaceae bacterium]